MIESISLIVAVASSLASILTLTKQVTDDKTENVIYFLNDIASTLEEAIEKFKNNEVPHGACEKMRQYSQIFPDVLQGIVNDERLQEYSRMLYAAHDIELLMISARDENALTELEKAVGYFRASATIIKSK